VLDGDSSPPPSTPQVVAAQASLPFPAPCSRSLPEALCAHPQAVPWRLLSPCGERGLGLCFAQAVVLRGIGKEGPSRYRLNPGTLGSSDIFPNEFWVISVHPLPYSTSHVLEQPCPTQPPYPQFFSPLLSTQGFLLDRPPPYSSAAVESIPVLAALQSATVVHTLLQGLYKDLQKLNIRRWTSFFSAGVEQQEFQEALEELRTLAQCYQTGFDVDESEDEADSD
ncbi:MSTO1 protein, partial [Rostratula benghalensis]|nr:MSTO1 protein [Rostratula benghalensis]